MLKRGERYFASPQELNDTHECKPKLVFDGTKEIWLRFIDYILINICIKLQLKPNSTTANTLIQLSEIIYNNINDKRKLKNIELLNAKDILESALRKTITPILNEVEIKYITQTFDDFFHVELQDYLTEVKYISSFTTDATNPTMWGHYGAAENGFITIYESHNNIVCLSSEMSILDGYRRKSNGIIELGIYDECGLEFKKVIYVKMPAKVNAFRRLIHKFRFTEQESHYDFPESLIGDAKSLEESNIGLVKYSDWRYESEYRLIFPSFTEVSSPLRTLRVEGNHIKGVIFGSKTSKSDRERIAAACHHLLISSKIKNDFLFFEIKSNPNKYKLDITAYGKLKCQILPNHSLITRINELPDKKSEEIINIAKNITTNR